MVCDCVHRKRNFISFNLSSAFSKSILEQQKKNDSILLFDGAEYIHGIVSPHHLVELVVATVHGAHTKKWEAELNGSGELMVGGRVSEVKTWRQQRPIIFADPSHRKRWIKATALAHSH